MRIAIIDPSLFTWPYDSALGGALQAAGHDVRIFGKALPEAEAGPSFPLLEPHFYRQLPRRAPADRLGSLLFLARKGVSHAADMSRLIVDLKRWKPDVVHFQWTPLPLVDRMFISAIRRLAPTLLTVHDSAPFNGNPRLFVQGLGAVAIMSQFQRLIVHTHAAAARLRSYGLSGQRIRCVPHGPLDTAPADPSRNGAAGAVHPDHVTVLLFGRIKPYKGVDLLLKAAAIMPREARDRCRIRIVGEAFMDLEPLRQLMEKTGMGERVQLEPRFVDEREIGNLFRDADILALPYREIDASGVLMSALTAGKPIVASTVGLFAELLVDGTHGRLFAVEDVAALSSAMADLILDASKRERMGRQVSLLREQTPNWAAIAKLSEDVYRELLAPEPARESS